jgi:acetylornithine deacetylase
LTIRHELWEKWRLFHWWYGFMVQLSQIKQQLAQLVAAPSVSSSLARLDQSNLEVIHLLANWLEALNFQVEILPVPEHPNKANLIATLGQGAGGLVLSGHTDTVPCDPSLWADDPFELTERDDKWYGLGATDMKGFFPVAMAAAQAFSQQSLKQPLIILATADEESSMSGARALTQMARPHGRYAVIGEPTGLTPIRAHKGILMEAIRIQGKSGHSSNPALGHNAMEDMQWVLAELLAFRQQMQSEHQNPLFEVDVPTLNLGHIHGGDNPNRICGHCELHFDIRPLPGMNIEELRGLLLSRLQKLMQEHQIALTFTRLFPGVPAFEQAAESELVRTVERLSGREAQAVAFATEAPFLQELGHETLVFGPGSIDQAHQPDEFIALDQVQRGVAQIQQLIAHFCL